MQEVDLLNFTMENKKSGLAILAEQMPAVKAYKQVAWNINHIRKTDGPLPGATLLTKCISCLEQDNGRNMMKQWKIDLLELEKPYCTDRFFTMTSAAEKNNDKKQETIHFLVCNTHPNLNIVLEIDINSRRACWLYYDALKETALQHVLLLVLQLFVKNEIRSLNVHHVAIRLNIGHVKTFFKRNNYIIQIEQPPTGAPAPNIHP